MVTVTGKLEASANDSAVQGEVEVMLCGYGSRVPRVNGKALVAKIQVAITTQSDGTFSFTVDPNDTISPAGTYYTVTVKDANGDAAQINAYRFLSDPDTYDLNLIEPYDPNQPPPPLPPLLMNMLQIVPGVTDAHFDGAVYTAWKVTLYQDIPGAYLSNLIPGNLYTFIIVQDATGHHKFDWPHGPAPYGLHNPTVVDPEPNATTIQTFACDESFNLWPIGPATYFP